MSRVRAGRLSNQELDELRSKLAQVAAHDPRVPQSDERLKPRVAANARRSKPMTSIYRAIADPQQEEGGSFLTDRRPRPSKKTLASIEYERQFAAFDSTDAKRSAASSSTTGKAISAAAKSVLQDEYVTRPREVSVIPQSLASMQTAVAARSDPRPTGKRMPSAPAIAQVFLS